MMGDPSATPKTKAAGGENTSGSRILEQAAGLRGMTLTSSLARRLKAVKTIKDFEMLDLCDEAREVFINALQNPPAPNEAMRLAAERYEKNTGI